MRSRFFLIAGVAGLLASGTVAHAESFNWSFIDDNTGDLVTGTISGLTEGVNDVSPALSATVTMAGDTETLGSGYGAFTYPTATNLQIDVTNDVVTFANMEFLRNETEGYQTGGQTLFFGTDPAKSTYYPELANNAFGDPNMTNQYSREVGDVFTPIAVSAAPEPSTWALMILGLGGIGFAFRQAKRKHGLRFKDCFAS